LAGCLFPPSLFIRNREEENCLPCAAASTFPHSKHTRVLRMWRSQVVLKARLILV
jgi:hypothetical protein